MNNILYCIFMFVHFIFGCVCGFDKFYVLQTEFLSGSDPSSDPSMYMIHLLKALYSSL